jgi:hypothetical protein
MKCAICKHTVEETFLKKPLGTFVRDKSHKKQIVCKRCQSQLSMDEIKSKI